MAIRPRARHRVQAIRRAPDGSAFQKCDWCGGMVAIALFDMHECGIEKNVKRFKGVCPQQQIIVPECNYVDQPRSAFRFFMESFEMEKKGNLVDIDREGFETWKKMSWEERQPYIYQAERVISASEQLLYEELIHYSQADDDEADSAKVRKFDQMIYERYEESEDSDCDHGSETYWSEGSYCNSCPFDEGPFGQKLRTCAQVKDCK